MKFCSIFSQVENNHWAKRFDEFHLHSCCLLEEMENAIEPHEQSRAVLIRMSTERKLAKSPSTSHITERIENKKKEKHFSGSGSIGDFSIYNDSKAKRKGYIFKWRQDILEIREQLSVDVINFYAEFLTWHPKHVFYATRAVEKFIFSSFHAQLQSSYRFLVSLFS